MRDERWFSGEEITTLVASPLSCANDGDDDEDEEDEEEETKKGDEDDEEEEEPVWTAPNDHRQVTVGRPTSLSKRRLRRRILIFSGINVGGRSQ